MKRNNLLLSCVVVLLASCHQPAISASLSTENESQNNVTQNNTIVEGQDKKTEDNDNSATIAFRARRFGENLEFEGYAITFDWEPQKKEIYYTLNFDESYYAKNPTASHIGYFRFWIDIPSYVIPCIYEDIPPYLTYTDENGDSVSYPPKAWSKDDRRGIAYSTDKKITISYQDCPEEELKYYDTLTLTLYYEETEVWSNYYGMPKA